MTKYNKGDKVDILLKNLTIERDSDSILAVKIPLESDPLPVEFNSRLLEESVDDENPGVIVNNVRQNIETFSVGDVVQYIGRSILNDSNVYTVLSETEYFQHGENIVVPVSSQYNKTHLNSKYFKKLN